VWYLALVGLRLGELCGLRQADIDFGAQTISIETRVAVDGQVVGQRHQVRDLNPCADVANR
jgi:integrase